MKSLCGDSLYKQAIKTLVCSKRIVVYCGAGVTLSRTGLSWGQLVKKLSERVIPLLLERNVLGSAFGEFYSQNEIAEKLKNYFTNKIDQPLKNATLLSELLERHSKETGITFTLEEKLFEILAECLYAQDANGKYHGTYPSGFELLFFLCRAITALSSVGKEIGVVTTNYDTYIESDINIAASGSGDTEKICLRKYGFQSPSRVKLNWQDHSIPFVYLHGRVPRSQDLGKDDRKYEIVLSEGQYAAAEKRVSAWLDAVSKDTDCILILGASMEDRPLLRFLQKNRERRANGKSKGICKNVILVKAADPYSINERRLSIGERKYQVEIERLRYTHIGVDYFIPLPTYSDVPVFLRDALHLLPCHSKQVLDEENWGVDLSEEQLVSWTNKASTALDNDEITCAVSRTLDSKEAALCELFSAVIGPASYGKVVVRLELWLRGVAPCPGKIDWVSRVADSDSFSLQPEARRVEYLYRRFPSRTAALRVMQYGRARLESLSKYGENPSASRWQAFYTRPLTRAIGDGKYPIVVGSIVISLGLSERDGIIVTQDDRECFQKTIDLIGVKLATGEDRDCTKIHIVTDMVGKSCLDMIESHFDS